MKILSLFVCFVVIYADFGDAQNSKAEVIIYRDPNLDYRQIEAGSSLELTCFFVEAKAKIWWMKDNENLTSTQDRFTATWSTNAIRVEESGDYVCVAATPEGDYKNATIHVTVIDPNQITSNKTVYAKKGSSAYLSCPIDEDDIQNSEFEWRKVDDSKVFPSTVNRNGLLSMMTLEFPQVNHEDNGTYECIVNHEGQNRSIDEISLFVTDKPEIKLSAKAVGAHSIYLNWTVNEHNSEVTAYNIRYLRLPSGYSEDISLAVKTGESTSSYLLKGLENGTSYKITITAANSMEISDVGYTNPEITTTLAKDPEYIPVVHLKKENRLITIEFSKIPENLTTYNYYYNVSVNRTHKDHEPQMKYLQSNGTSVIIDIPETRLNFTYTVKVASCNGYTEECRNWTTLREGVNSRRSIMTKNVTNMSANLHPLEIDVKIQVRVGGFLTIFNINSRKIQSSEQID